MCCDETHRNIFDVAPSTVAPIVDVNNYIMCDRTIEKRKFACARGISADPLNFREVADPAVFPNRFSAPPWELLATAGERKYCPAEVGHDGKLKELAGSFRLAGERRFCCVVTNCINNTRAFSDLETESFKECFMALRYLAMDYVKDSISIFMCFYISFGNKMVVKISNNKSYVSMVIKCVIYSICGF